MENKGVIITWVIRKLFPIILSLIFVILIVTECSREYDDIDYATKQREPFSVEYVVDKTYNGFEVTYATKYPVTKYRLDEMYLRPHIQKNINMMKDSVINHFGCLLYTNIYDFSDFIKPIHIDSNLVIESIYVYGTKKNRMYIGKNPRINNSALWYDPNTGQGSQYINHYDIYYRHKNERIYRYYKCYGLFDMSKTDERFSHFSEEERVY